MPSLELTNEQVSDLVAQLLPEQKHEILMTLAEGAENGRDRRIELAESRLARLARQRCQKWEAMSEDEREAFVNELIHEDRACRK